MEIDLEIDGTFVYFNYNGLNPVVEFENRVSEVYELMSGDTHDGILDESTPFSINTPVKLNGEEISVIDKYNDECNFIISSRQSCGFKLVNENYNYIVETSTFEINFYSDTFLNNELSINELFPEDWDEYSENSDFISRNELLREWEGEIIFLKNGETNGDNSTDVSTYVYTGSFILGSLLVGVMFIKLGNKFMRGKKYVQEDKE